MSKLTALDSAFLFLESQELPAHVAMLQTYQLPKGKSSAWLNSMMDELRHKPPGAPFNLRVKMHLTGLPEMVVDEDFDIDYHLRHTVLPKPGNDEQLRNVVARLHGNLLDRDRPLWEFHLIEGLEHRRFAFYIKIHHAICDGATFAKWMSESTDVSRTQQPMKPVWERAIRQASPTERPWLDKLQAPANMLRTYRDLGLGLGELGAKLLKERFINGNKKHRPAPVGAPHGAQRTPDRRQEPGLYLFPPGRPESHRPPL
jgi:diacylglycerol O-acyltransferase